MRTVLERLAAIACQCKEGDHNSTSCLETCSYHILICSGKGHSWGQFGAQSNYYNVIPNNCAILFQL